MKKFGISVLSFLMALSLGACTKPAESAASAAGSETQETVEETTILVAAAASLKNAYENELIPMFEEANPGIKVEGTYDSSGKLQTQIEEGLAADVFMSAAMKQMNALIEKEYIVADDSVQLLINKIVLIVPADSDTALAAFEDIANAETIAIGDPESVPAGQYAKEALTTLGLWDTVEPKLSLGTNVTEVLNQVAAASADAGIVYATDAASTADVKVIAAAPEGSLAKEVIYPVAKLKNTEHAEAADKFVAFLQTQEALDVFVKYGFTVK